MRVPLEWLRELVPADLPAPKLAELMDLSGTKVEAIHQPGRGVGGVVVAEVLAITDHPNANNLILVDVRADGEDASRVVCGARNFSVGDLVPYAQVGARLAGMKIAERKIRGETSMGMLCSASELGISDDHSGILVLPSDAPRGEEVGSLLGLGDSVLELEVTQNRPDCMSMIGVAREVAAVLGEDLTLPTWSVDEADLGSKVQVEVRDPEGCPRYLARFLEGLGRQPSPAWISKRLTAAGIRPISGIVDVTNYVMVETGQPLHAFDASLVDGSTIVVRRARSGEEMRTLDGVDRTLHPEDLLIADPLKPLGFAGVMGGGDTEVSESTSQVILESAHFDRVSIAYTSRRHSLRTEASARFERGADPEMVPQAAARAAGLMTEVCGGRVAQEVVDVYPVPIERPQIRLRPGRTNAVLGIEISSEVQVAHLRALGIEVTPDDATFVVKPPTSRPDLNLEEDLIEEIARLAGFDRLASTLPPGRTGALSTEQAGERALRRQLVAAGLDEAYTTSFMDPADLDDLGLAADHPARSVVALANPTSEDEPVLRSSLLPGLLRSVARNLAHRAAGVGLFEVARIYEPTDQQLMREPLIVGGIGSGLRTTKNWRAPESPWDFFSMKGIVEMLLARGAVEDAVFEPVVGMPFHPTRAARVGSDGRWLGAVGELHPDVCAAFDVGPGTVAFELVAAPLLPLATTVAVAELARYPGVYVDLAVVVDESVSAADLFDIITEAGRPELASVRLFDLYRGEQVPAGQKSVAFALEVRDPDRTLTDEDAMSVRERIIEALGSRTGATLRG